MAESRTFEGSVIANLGWTYTLLQDSTDPIRLNNSTDVKSLALTAASLTTGTGLNQANRLFHQRRSLATTVGETISLYNFAIDGGAAQTDSLGQAMLWAKIKVLLIYNRTLTAGENLKIGGEGSAAAWQQFFQVSGAASDTAGGIIGPGGLFLIVAPSLAGYSITNTSDHLLKILNAGSGTIEYDIVAVGVT